MADLALDLAHLRAFHAVVQAGGFSAAAGRLHRTQSAVSHAVGKLERSAKVRLLDRRGRQVVPTPEGRALGLHAADLAGLDAVVVDLQDAGTRFYTYLTSVGWLMEEAAKAKVAVVVLDRPDPIGGALVEGPPADPDRLSFTGLHSCGRLGRTYPTNLVDRTPTGTMRLRRPQGEQPGRAAGASTIRRRPVP